MEAGTGGRTAVTAVEPAPFGVLLRRLRVAAGLTQEELAERSQVSERAIRHLERDGERTPRLQTVRLLAQALELGGEAQARLLAAARPVDPDAAVLARSSPPRALGSLIGREDDLAIVNLLIAERHLVTVTGAGGVGKTRLALAVAEKMHPRFDRVTIAELASLREPADVLSTIARCLSIRGEGTSPMVDLVGNALDFGTHLLVLDNMEHLLEARTLVLDLLSACKQLTVLVTSREPLQVRGERVYTLGPLLLPESAADIERSPAVRLFIERAEEAGAALARDKATTDAVAEICRRLDGLPLAIELAAAWARRLPPPTLLRRLGTRLASLDHGPADLPARQRTMRDAINWSYDLLDSSERVLFRRLSVFVSGCTLDAVEAVCGCNDALDRLVGLVDKSLLTVEETPGDGTGPRFNMLETVREFARDRLAASMEADAISDTHGRYFLGLALEGRPRLEGPDQALWLERLEREHDNFRAALHTAQRNHDVDLGLRLAGCLWPFWHAHGHWKEAQTWLGMFLNHANGMDIAPAIRGEALLAAGELAGALQSTEMADPLYRQVLVLGEQRGDGRLHGMALHYLAGIAMAKGEYHAAERMLEESLSLVSRAGDRSGTAAVLRQQASLHRYQGAFEQAMTRYQESLALSRELGDTRRIAEVLARIGQLLADRGRPTEALVLYTEALTLFRELRDPQGMADALYRTGSAASDTEKYHDAVACFEESLALYRSLGNKYGAAYVLLNHAEAAVRAGDIAAARALAPESLRLFEEIGDRRCVALVLLELADVAREENDFEHALALYKQSLELSLEQNLRPGIVACLEKMARFACLRGEGEHAACLHGAAGVLREGMQAVMPPADRIPHDRALEAVRRQMGDEAFRVSETQGRDMLLSELAALVRSGDIL
jgi:predicted ATPase/DNA-binding XRE family transcriptional regulator